MLNKIIRTYILAFLSLFIFFNLDIKDSNVWIVLAQLITFLFFSLNLLYVNNRNHSFRASTLMKNVLGISLFIVFINNLVSYYYNGNFFVFSESDAMLYHLIGENFQLNNYNLFKAILNARGSELKYDDWGMSFLISIIYFIYNSNIALNLFYIIISVFSAKHMYSLSNNFLPIKFAYLATLTFITSSYVLWFNSSGLKESFMIFLVLVTYDFYYKYLKKRNYKLILLTIIPLILMLFFRPAVSILIVVSMGIGVVVNLRQSFAKFFLILMLIIVSVFSISLINEQKQKYAGTDYDSMIETKEVMIKGSIPFTYTVNTLGAFLGPFPTFSIESKVILSFFASGLLFKVFISVLSFFALVTILYRRIKILFPLVFFLLLEVLSLIYILEALELRKSLPHFPFFYILGFWTLYQMSRGKFSNLKKYYSSVLVLITLAVFYWNLR